MAFPRRLLALMAAAIAMTAACGPLPAVTPTPSGTVGPVETTDAPQASDVPFVTVAWPAVGSACTQPGYAGRIGRVEAPDARTVVFTLCGPDGAFLARLAHPSLGVVDAGDLARLAADPASARDIAGHGAYRIVGWGTDNVELARIASATPSSIATTVILRWAVDPAARSAALVNASVDGIDAPAPDGLDAVAMNPELALVPRAGLATALLGFGSGSGFASAKVRRAIASGIDRSALAAAAFGPGSTPADHIVPCEVPSGCSGAAYAGFNAPAAVAALQAEKFDLGATYPLHVPDGPIPGLPDPAGTAAAIRDQLAGNLGLQVTIDVMPLDTFRARVADGTLSGLYLDGIAASVADPSAFLEPLFTAEPASLAARRAAGVAKALAAAASTSDPAARDAAFAAAATSLRTTVPLAPLVHPGTATAYRADVKGAAASPLGTDPLGAMTAGDRGQVVFMAASAPGGGWCGDQPSFDAYRLCGLATDGLYGTAAGSLDPTPRLAASCAPGADTATWTCRMRTARTSGGLVLDAADVVATFRAMGDPSDPVHRAAGGAAFAAWTAVFGAFLPAAATP